MPGPDGRYTRAVREFLLGNGAIRMATKGSSMFPCLKCGQVVTLMPLKSKKLAPGHCYAYLRKGRLTLHRFAGMHGPMALFTGDNTCVVAEIGLHEIVGEALAVEATLRNKLLQCVDAVCLPLLSGIPYFLRVRRVLLNILWR